MTISSRTPEGEPNRCPVCGAAVCVEPSLWFGDAPCPNCGQLLWFFRSQRATRLWMRDEAEAIRHRLVDAIARRLRIPRDAVTGDAERLTLLAGDSLAVVELVMELEEECGLEG